MVDETNPLAFRLASAGNQILGRDREDEGTLSPLEPKKEEDDNRAQPNQDDRDRVEISTRSRQRLGSNTAAASNEAVASPSQVQNTLRPNHVEGDFQATPDLLDIRKSSKGPQNIIDAEQTLTSAMAGQLSQRPDQVDNQGRMEVLAAPRQNFTQGNINTNTDIQPDQGNARQSPAGQNPVAQQIQQNISPATIGSNPRATLPGQNPSEETVRQNNSAVDQIQKTLGRGKVSLEETPQGQIQTSAPISPDVEEMDTEPTPNNRWGLPGKQNIITALNIVSEIRQQKAAEEQTTGEAAVRLPEVVDESILDIPEIPEQDLGSFVNDTGSSDNPKELGETNDTQKVRGERAEEQRQTESVENEEQQLEAQNQEDLSREPIGEQTQIGRNIDRLV